MRSTLDEMRDELAVAMGSLEASIGPGCELTRDRLDTILRALKTIDSLLPANVWLMHDAPLMG